ncbi:MAG: hypothetical protein K0S97_1490 [Chloroflexota bacterium]|jgi:hypothetical protein|nr:hypothetical protein [Chloroflexota bacterium]
MHDELPGEQDRDRRLIFRIGSIAGFGLAVITILHSIVFSIVGLPTNVTGWFDLFGRNPVGGLLAFEALMVVYVVLSVPVVLALYTALRPTSGSLMAVYVGISVIGIVAFIVARPAFEMLSLSNGYAAAATDAERAAYLAAGTATYAAFHGTAFWVSYLIGSLGGLVLSAVILRGTIFSRRTAYVRIASSVFDFGLFVPGVGLLIALLSVVCLLAFNLMVARRLAQLARTSAASVRTLEQRALAI